MSFTDTEQIKAGLEEYLSLDSNVFRETLARAASDTRDAACSGRVRVSGILALGNYCVNDCLYCGLRSESCVKRFRLDKAVLRSGTDFLVSAGIKRIVLISGEDPAFPFDVLLDTVSYASALGMRVSLGAGVFSKPQLSELKAAGAAEFCMKFETSDRVLFARIKPSSDWNERMRCLETAAAAGFDIATGSIVGLAGQTPESVAEDIRLTASFKPAWVPVVPYIPAPGTPMAESTPMGSVELTLKCISLLRLLLPDAAITAGQPSQDSGKGFGDPGGNLAALEYGADIFFVDATPAAVSRDFSIVGERLLPRLEQIKTVAELSGLRLN